MNTAIRISGHRFSPSYKPAGIPARPPLGSRSIYRIGQPPFEKLKEPLGEKEIYSLAGTEIVRSGVAIGSKMTSIYEQYKGLGSFWLAEAAASFFVVPPVGAALDLWWQSNRTKEALVSLEAARRLGQEWVNAMTQEGIGWFPVFLDGIEKTDPALAAKAGATYDKVVTTLVNINNLLSEAKELPPYVAAEFISSMWSDLSEDAKSSARFMTDLSVLLRNMLEGLAGLAKAGKNVSEAAPTIVVIAGLGIIFLIFVLK